MACHCCYVVNAEWLIVNDFTKEELGELKRCVKYMIEGGVTPYSSLTMALNKKLQSLIDNYCDPAVDYGHLNDKHIGQWAGYLIEEYPRWQELEKLLSDNPEIEKVFLEMYKKGFQDCK